VDLANDSAYGLSGSVWSADRERAIAVANRVRKSLIASGFHLGEGIDISISASFGIATYPAHGVTKDDLIRQADAAMYRVKSTTKNAVGIATVHQLVGRGREFSADQRAALIVRYPTGIGSALEALATAPPTGTGWPPSPGRVAPTVDTNTTRPHPADRMSGRNAWLTRTAVTTFVS